MIPTQFWAVEMQGRHGEYKYIHNGKVGISTAFEIKENSVIQITIPRLFAANSVVLEIYDESVSNMLLSVDGEWCGLCGENDIYDFTIETEKLGTGLYFMRPRLCAFATNYFGHRWGRDLYFDKDYDLTNLMQMTVCDFAYSEPKKIRGGVIYQIFVDRFRRGGAVEIPDGARVIRGEWRSIPEYPAYPGAPLYNNTFYGGTLWGVIEKLDYIKSLGVNALYLNPIFKAASNHKYDTADYMQIDPIFGGEEAFTALVEACRKRDIEIILDGVFNHTGSDSIYFNRYGRYPGTGAYQSKRSEYYDWYHFEEHPGKYASWWGIDILPRINPDNPKCGNYFVGENGVIEKYASQGILGFRLDVADELSDSFISKIKERLDATKTENILYGEVWEDASNKSSYGNRRKYYLGQELDGVMNYPLRTGIIEYLLGWGCGKLAYALTEVTANAPERILHNQMNLLGTHDTERILTILGGEPKDNKSNKELATIRMDGGRRSFATKKLMTAYTILATMPGIPTIFYGDEAGLEGYGDPFNRMPYPWGKEDHKLIEHYRNLGKLRQENSVYKNGEFNLIYLDATLLVFSRESGDDSFVTIVNNSDVTMTFEFEDEVISLLNNKTKKSFNLSEHTAAVFKAKKNSYFTIV